MNRNIVQIITALLFLTLVFGQENKQNQYEFGKKHKQQQAFLDFKRIFAKLYRSIEHEQYRFNVFLENLNEIDKLNKEITSAQFGITKFSDFTQEEFLKFFTGVVQPNASDEPISRKLETPPGTWDIRNQGPSKLQKVKDQGQCGSCWAFSTIATIENLNNIKYHHDKSFSEQDLVDCAYQRDGCQGGWFTDAYNYCKNQGLASEINYPYTGEAGNCKSYQMDKNLYKIAGYLKLQNDNNFIQSAIVTKGAVAVCVDATNWNSYQSGIYSNPSTSTPTCNHAVTIIGYGPGYWLIRNSWGKS
ncbi:hypothetical protein ABPG72_015176 [Tetrahymena utriculariae]